MFLQFSKGVRGFKATNSGIVTRESRSDRRGNLISSDGSDTLPGKHVTVNLKVIRRGVSSDSLPGKQARHCKEFFFRSLRLNNKKKLLYLQPNKYG